MGKNHIIKIKKYENFEVLDFWAGDPGEKFYPKITNSGCKGFE